MTRLSAIFFCLFLSAFFANAASGGNAVDTDKTASKEYCASAYNPCHGGDILKYFANPQTVSLDAQEREMIACAVLSSTRNLRELKAVVEAALDRGASALALRQSILSAAPYSGMPACIDALAVFPSDFEENMGAEDALAQHAKEKGKMPEMDHAALARDYPVLYQSMLQLIHNSGERINQSFAAREGQGKK